MLLWPEKTIFLKKALIKKLNIENQMKINFFELGQIKSTFLEMNTLTIIIGPNNSGKSYISYSVYGIWKFLNTLAGKTYHSQSIYAKRNKNKFFIEINEKYISSLISNINNNLKDFENHLGAFFQDTSGKLFLNTKFKIDFTKDFLLKNLENFQKKRYNYNDVKIDFHTEANCFVFEIEEEKFKEELSMDFFRQVSLAAIIETNKTLFPKPFLLPAERNSFIITYKMLENRRYNILKNLQRQKMQVYQKTLFDENNVNAYPQPIEDFLNFLTDLELEKHSNLKILKNKNPFQELADEIENKIQNKNKIKFERARPEGRDLKVKINRELSIDLYNASSSIKQLTPLLLYLRYRAKVNDLLIIDEPELNLHPEAQVKILEILCIIVKSGIRVLITTHSPYFIAHLNNLLSGNLKNEEILKRQSKNLYLTDSRAFLSSEEVSAYEMRENELVSLKSKDGIDWGALSDISADIQSRFFKIYDEK